MPGRKKTSDGVSILHNRYVKGDPARAASVQEERVNAQVAAMIYNLRTGADLTQKELADLIGTKQSVISRLEDADYDGHSLSMLSRIAEALKQKMVVEMTAADPEVNALRYTFHVFVRLLRRQSGFTVEDLAEKADIDREEVEALERVNGYRPSPLTIHKLSRFYGIPEERMLMLAGAVREVSPDLSREASRFAAKAESFAKLTDEERQTLDEFIKFLKSEIADRKGREKARR